MQPYKGDGIFQWNTWGWFGAQIGSTAYLVILGGALACQVLLPGLLILACGLIPNIAGYAIWRHRERLAPYPAIQKLMLTIFLFTAIALGIAIFYEHAKNLEKLSGATRSTWILLLFPALMLMFHFQEQAGKKPANTRQPS